MKTFIFLTCSSNEWSFFHIQIESKLNNKLKSEVYFWCEYIYIYTYIFIFRCIYLNWINNFTNISDYYDDCIIRTHSTDSQFDFSSNNIKVYQYWVNQWRHKIHAHALSVSSWRQTPIWVTKTMYNESRN